MKKAVLFDCDGVLVDSEHIIEAALTEVFVRHGANFTHLEIREMFTGLSYDQYIERRREAYERATGREMPPEFQQALDDVFTNDVEGHLTAAPGVHDLVASLRQSGIPYAVASNCRMRGLELRLRESGLADLFGSRVFSREHVARAKPAPDVYVFAAGNLGISPLDCIVVEDSAPGVRAGVAAGAHVIGIARQDIDPPGDPQKLLDAGAHEIVYDMAQLKAVIFALTGKAAPRPGGNKPAP